MTCETNNTNMFKDAHKFGKAEDGSIVFKTDCSTWAKVLLNNLPLDAHLFSQITSPEIICNFGFSQPPVCHVEKKRILKNRLRLKRKKNPIGIEKVEEEDNETVEWDHRPRCEHCDMLLEFSTNTGFLVIECPYYCDPFFGIPGPFDMCFGCGTFNWTGDLCIDCREELW